MNAVQSDVNGEDLALVPGAYMTAPASVPWMHRIEAHPSWSVLSQVPETLIAYIALPHFTVKQLLSLEKGSVVVSETPTSDLIPVRVGSVRLVWGEFEMVDRNLALRVTKLA